MAQIGSFTRTKSGFHRASPDALPRHRTCPSFRPNPPTPRTRRTIAFTPATTTDRRSARAGSAPARRPASMSRSRSTIPPSRSRSAPTSSSRATTSPPASCSGTVRRSATTGADPCGARFLLLRQRDGAPSFLCSRKTRLMPRRSPSTPRRARIAVKAAAGRRSRLLLIAASRCIALRDSSGRRIPRRAIHARRELGIARARRRSEAQARDG